MVVVLNIGRLLMVAWALYALVLVFLPQMVNHAPDQKLGAIQFALAYGIGWCLDRLLGMVRRRQAANEGVADA